MFNSSNINKINSEIVLMGIGREFNVEEMISKIVEKLS